MTFQADSVNLTVRIKQTGPNMSAVNGVPLGKDRERIVHHGDSVHFLLGQFEHLIEFDPNPDTLPTAKLKRQLECEQPSASKKICDDSLQRDTSSILVNQNKWESLKGGKVLFYQSKGTKSSRKV